MLVQGIAGDKNAIGYFGYAYYVENKDKLKAVPVVPRQGRAVAPTRDARERHLPAAVAADLHLRQQEGGRRRGGEFVEFYLDRTPRHWSRRSGTSRCRARPTSWRNATSGAARTGTVFGGHAGRRRDRGAAQGGRPTELQERTEEGPRALPAPFASFLYWAERAGGAQRARPWRATASVTSRRRHRGTGGVRPARRPRRERDRRVAADLAAAARSVITTAASSTS